MARHPFDASMMSCQCGMRFRTAIAEARHRHNFPVLCRGKRKKPIGYRCQFPDGHLGPVHKRKRDVAAIVGSWQRIIPVFKQEAACPRTGTTATT